MFITSPTHIFGLDISDLSLKAVQIKSTKDINYIQAINSLALPPGLIEEGVIKDKKKVALAIKKLIKKSPDKFTSNYVIVSLPESKTFIKLIQLSSTALLENNTDGLIREELPKHVPLDVSEVQIDWQEIKNNHKNREFLVGTVPTMIVNDLVETCKMASLNITALEVEAQAIERCITPQIRYDTHRINWQPIFFTHNKKQPSETAVKLPQIILDLGATRTSIILIDEGTIQFANSIDNISGNKVTHEIANKKNLSYAEAEKAKLICGSDSKKCKGEILNIINEFIDNLAKEIIKANNFYQDHFGKDTNEIEIILCGGGANLFHIDKILKDKLKRRVTVANPLININSEKLKHIKNIYAYTTAIGLGLRNYS